MSALCHGGRTPCHTLAISYPIVVVRHARNHNVLFVTRSKIGTVTKGSNVRLANRPFLVFDFPALWHSGLSARVESINIIVAV